ncbi:MAG: PKD domain-containing protein [Bacteroidota bacterium]
MVDVVVTAWATLFGSLQSVVVTYQHPFEVNPSPGANFTVSTTGNTANFTNTSTGAGNAYTWDFGDGNTSTMVSPSHTYAMMGNYTVCLIANNGNCADTTCMNQAVGCPAPAVGWTSTSTNFTVDFTDQTPGNPQSWFWDLGDGNTSTMQNPTHVYAANGNYLVCLTVTDSCGTDSSCQMVTVNCAAPTAAFTFTSNLLDVDFTDASTSSDFIANWIWTFGDGNSSTMQNPSHTYAADGIYTVCLQVFDTCGIDSSCQTVNVTSIGVEAPALHSLNVFPNPTSGDFVLQGVAEFGLPVAIQVSDLLGKTIFTIEEKALNGPFEERISLAGATPGMYFVRINAGNQQQTLKLILE